MCSGECACGVVPFQGVFTEIIHRISQVSDIGGVSGDIGGVGRHVIVGGFQLRTVDGVGAGIREFASGDIGDFVGGVSAVCSGECACGVVPFQGVFTEIIHRISQVSDIGGVSGDIGGVGRHVIVGGFQLRTVDGVGAGIREFASGDVGDFVGGVSAVCSGECACGVVPFQGVFTEIIHRISQVSDIGGVSGDIGGVGRHVIVGGFQLRTVDGVGAGIREFASGDIGDFAGDVGAVCGAERGAVPQQSILLQVVQLRAVYYIGAGCRNRTFSNISDFTGGI